MATFVLVHGAWRGSWSWKRVRDALRPAGHHVFTPTLTGLGERSHLLSPDITLETHIRDVVNLIRWEDLSDIVLCGHSYGGCVLTGVADRIPDRIRALVYLDAFVPGDGETVLELITEDRRTRLLHLAHSVGDGWKVPPIPAEVLNVNLQDRPWVDAQCTMQPLATLEQPIKLSGGLANVNSVVYVLAAGYTNGSPFPPFFDRARRNGWRTFVAPCGHDLMLDLPDYVARILVQSAEPHPAASTTSADAPA